MQQFIYTNYRYQIRKLLDKIEREKKHYGKLKTLLLPCYKFKYLDLNPKDYNASKKCDRERLIAIAREFADLKLVTRKTIKERGWTDKLIDRYLIVDIFAKNPYYKKAGDMRLYCLKKVEILEAEPEIKTAIADSIARRLKLKLNNEQRLALAPYKWLAAIGDPYIAIALLLRLLNKAIKDVPCYEQRSSFYNLKDKVLKRLINFKAQTFIARKEVFGNRPLYCHWFNVNGYKLCFHSYESLGYEDDFSLEEYNIEYNSKLEKSDQKLLFKLSGWRTIKEATEGLSHLIAIEQYLGRFSLKINNISLFSSPKHPEPPTGDDLFILKLNREKDYLFMNFKTEIININKYRKFGCPLGFDCKIMGGINNYRCANFSQCTKP